MFDPDSSFIFLFGDNHLNPRNEVRDRLRSVIPDGARAMVIEHPVKSPHETEASRWAYLKNPSSYLVQFLSDLLRTPFQWRSKRAVLPHHETVAEEVAEELGLAIEYTDIPFRQRFEEQPFWLTSVSWTAVLLLFLGWRIAPWVPLLGLFSVVSVAFVTQRVFFRTRERVMAKDCVEAASRYDVIVVFVGDSHVEPLVDRLQGRVGVVLDKKSRPG